MSSDDGDQPPPASSPPDQKKPKLRYSRDFLLSFSGLDICKKLPRKVDPSVLSELREDSSSGLEWQRSARRGEYGGASNTRGSGGRWETHSSGSSDRDGDQQLDRESNTSDPGRRLGSQTRRPWQNAEQDGLLGSGSFPRPPLGHVGASALKTRGASNYQANKSTEPYQPPRPFKAASYLRKDGTDSINDETFGSAECSNEDRAEEERKRRASFELMRKEQHKALQEKQTLIPATGKLDTDIIALLETSKEKSRPNRSTKIDDPEPSVSQNDSSRTSCYTQAPLSRPLVPPGFANALTEKNVYTQSSSLTLGPEAGRTFDQNDPALNGVDHIKESINYPVASVDISMQKNDFKSTFRPVDARETLTAPSALKGTMHSIGFQNVSSEILGHLDANGVQKDVSNDWSNKKEARSEDIHTVGHNHSTSILEKLFGSSSLTSSSSNFAERQDAKTEVEEPALSSKFAQWFIEEDKKPEEDSSSRDLLSLITSNGTAGSRGISFSNKGIPSGNRDHVAENLKFSATPSIVGIPEQYCATEKLSSNSGVLTCEDLEQSILAQVNESSSSLQHSVQGTNVDANSREQNAEVDTPGSQLLLSLLQPGGKEPPSSARTGSTDKLPIADSSVIHGTDKTITLETLFGPSFMNALQSAEAPLSVKRGLAGDTVSMDGTQFHGPADDSFLLSSSIEYQASQNNNEESRSRYGDTSGVPKLGDIMLEGGPPDIQLPEESIFSDSSLFESGDEEFMPQKAEELLGGRSRNAMVRGGVHLNSHDLGDPALSVGNYENMANSDIIYNHLHGRQSLPIPHQMNPPHLAQRNPQMNFMGSDNIHHDPHNQFPMNLPRHGFNMAGGPGFDPVAHHQMVQHRPLPPNFPPHHSIQGLPRGVPQPRPMHHMPGYMPEMNSVHNYPGPNRQPNFGGFGMGMHGGRGHRPHPEVFERFMEMRGNSNQIHRNPGGYIPGSYNPEAERNFRYR